MKRLSILIFLLLLTACGTGMDPFVGLEQAEQQKQYFSSQLTATAESRFMGITETAAAWNFAATQTSFPYTATALAYTPTPVPTSTPNAAATLVMANAIAESTMVANQAELSNKAVERARISNMARAVGVYVIGLVVLFIAVMFGIAGAKRLAVIPAESNEQGKVLPMFDVVEGVAMDVDRLPNGVGSMRHSGLKSLPLVTAERQDAVTARAQMVDMKTRTRVTTAAVQKLLADQGVKALPAPTSAATVDDDRLFPVPDWNIVYGWQGEKNLFPYGLTSNGLGFIDVTKYPHWAVIGMTRTGKSRRFLRPTIACALAAGHRVVIIGKMTDYGVFKDEPNVTLVHINQMTKPEHAEYYGQVLLALLSEMEMRDAYLTQAHKSTWTYAGRENTFIVLDELQNAIRMMKASKSANADRVQMGVEGLVSEGAKIGFNIVVAGQRATGLAGVLSQTGKAVFRVEREEERAHKSLAGASDLQDGYFYARFGQVKLAGAFEPSDDEIREFLRSRPVKRLEHDWVDASFSDVTSHVLQADGDRQLPPIIQPRDEIAEMAESIRDRWVPTMSKRAMARLLGYSQYGGAYADKVDRVLNYLGATTSTAQKHPENGSFEPVVA